MAKDKERGKERKKQPPTSGPAPSGGSSRKWLFGLIVVVIVVGLIYFNGCPADSSAQESSNGAFVQIEGVVYFEMDEKLYTEQELGSLLDMHGDILTSYQEQLRISDEVIIPNLSKQITTLRENFLICEKRLTRNKVAWCSLCGVASGLAGFGVGVISEN